MGLIKHIAIAQSSRTLQWSTEAAAARNISVTNPSFICSNTALPLCSLPTIEQIKHYGRITGNIISLIHMSMVWLVLLLVTSPYKKKHKQIVQCGPKKREAMIYDIAET